MPELIDIALTPEEVASIETMLASLEDTMPFLIGLSPERVKALFKLGPQSEAFVQKTLEAAEQHARLLPASTPVAAMRRDAELRETLRPIRTRVARLLELLDGTMILAGADLMKSASAVYRTLRIHAKGEGIEDTLEDLGKRFAKRRKGENSEPIEDTEQVRAATEITRPVKENRRTLPTRPIKPEPPANAIGELNDSEAAAGAVVVHGSRFPSVKTQKPDRFHGRAYCPGPCAEISPATSPIFGPRVASGEGEDQGMKALFNRGPSKS